MKTTLEIPDPIFRRAKSVVAERGIPFREFVTEAVKEKLVADAKAAEQRWMAAFGKLRHLRKEAAKINRLIEFSKNLCFKPLKKKPCVRPLIRVGVCPS